jgi:RNA polymerase sigma-70 factor, ECF subfamily
MSAVYNEGMENIVKQYLKSVYNYIYRMTKDKNMTEDVVQETFVKVWKNLEKIDPKKNLKKWIFTIARNTTFDYFRKNKNISFSDEENIADLEPLPDEIFERKELSKELEKALSQIRPDFREIIFLHYVEDLTFAEISEIVGKPLNTVKSWHLRGLHQIRAIIRI